MNSSLAASGADYRLEMAEIVTGDQAEQAGITVFANDRGNKQLSSDFIPFDPNRTGLQEIQYLVDQSDGGTDDGETNAQTEGAIDNAMATWENVSCSNLPIVKVPDSGADPDLVDGLLGFGGVGTPFADITHGGWLPRGFFDALVPPTNPPCVPGENCGGDFILGVTFTFIFVDGAGNPVDQDGNGKTDTAFREIYYNDNFQWGIDVPGFFPVFDVETVALHEAGHGLSQAHFGMIFRTDANGNLHFAPEAVMNAAVFGQKQSLLGSDNGGHCSNWGSWPNN